MKLLGRIRMPLGEIVTLENSILEKITARDINEKEKKRKLLQSYCSISL